MNCPNCQTPNRDGAKRCRQCGAPLPVAPAPQAPSAPYSPQAQTPATPPYTPPQATPPYSPAPSGAPPYQPQTPAVPPQAVRPAQRTGIGAWPWKNIGIGCLLLFAGFIVGLAAALIGTALAQSNATPTPAAPPAIATPASAASVAPVTPAPPRPDKGIKAPTFTLKDTSGADKELNSLINGKLAVIVFWASPNAIDEQLGALKKFAEDNRGVVIGVNSEEVSSRVTKYSAEKGLAKFTMLLDGDSKVKEQYKITETPTYFLIDKNGVIVERLGAGTKRDELEKKLGELK